jgi:tetratricopeptide (TPR) repeat protein
VEIYRKAIYVDPEYADIYEDIADALKDKGEENLVLDIYEGALESGSKNASLYLNLGYQYHLAKRYNEAIEALQKSYKFDPENISTKVNLAENHLLVNQFEKAYSLAKELFEEKNIPAAEKLAVHFIAFSSLVFQGKKNEADAQLKTLENFYKSLPEDYEKSWSYHELENLIRENKELPEPDTQLLLKQIQELDPTKKKGKYLVGQP